MDKASSSNPLKKVTSSKNGRNLSSKLSSMLPKMEPFIRQKDHHNPKELMSWAKRTGFHSSFSGETGVILSEKSGSGGVELEKGIVEKNGNVSPKIEIDPVLGRGRSRGVVGVEGFGKNESDGGGGDDESGASEIEPVLLRGGDGGGVRNGGGPGNEATKDVRNVDGGDDGEEAGVEGGEGSSVMKCGMRDKPGFVPLICYGLQHYISQAGSLIFIPLIIVPAMGGTDKDTATVISTVLLVSGVTTILHSYLGTRLPLVQGSSFVYLAPALVILNSREHRNLTEHKFRHIMRELQGAIIVGSTFQSILGFSGLMSLLLRLINPVVVAPTVAAVGLAFFSYGIPQAGSCLEISIPPLLLVIFFSLHLRGVSISGQRLFQVYAVPLSVIIAWAYAFFLTAGGAYNYKGCRSDIPSSNILIDACRKHAYTMRHCRTDVSDAWRTTAWIRIPYPLQWGIPIFHLRTSIIMIIVSLVASVHSVGTYHSASLKINSTPPTPGIVSRGIGVEGFCSLLAGLWGSGTGSTTLTENVHTINVTKVANRRALELGAAFMILFSFVGKIGAVLASMPLALAAAILCFMWALTVALGLSTLQYTQTSSFRNTMIAGVSLFLGLSIPAYFQQHQPKSVLILPGYFLPFSAASDGPVHIANKQIDFAINALLSLNMVVTLVVAFLLDNTVPGTREERGLYAWSSAEETIADPSSLSDYSLPRIIGCCFCLPKCLGA